MDLLRRGGALAVAAVCLIAAVQVTLGRGVGGREVAAGAVRRAFAGMGSQPVGEPVVSLQGDQALAWALGRVNPAHPQIAVEGGAVLWRVFFPGGGEGAATPNGAIWAARRPIPADPGANQFPATVQRTVRNTLANIFPDVESWRWVASQSWREGGVTWHRVRFTRSEEVLPEGWGSHIEVEVAGSSIVSFQHLIEPLASDVGVVMGRIAELELLRSVGIIGLVLVLVGVVAAGAEQVAFRRRVNLLAGAATGAVTWAAGVAAGLSRWECGLGAVLAGVVVVFLSQLANYPTSRRWIAAPAGVGVAVLMLALPRVVTALGGWLPPRATFPADSGLEVLAGRMWFPALTEELLLRGALPFLGAPVAGWWGGALVGALIGCLLHPLPAVPLAASLATELGLQLSMAAVARWGGLASAILARGVCEGLVRRAGFPADWAIDALVLGTVALVVLFDFLRRERR